MNWTYETTDSCPASILSILKGTSDNLFRGLHGKNTIFGYSAGLLVKDQMVYCTSGGADTNIVALNRFSGALIWKCKGKGQLSAFCSPRIVQRGSRNILLTFTELSMLGIDADNGKLLFTHKQDTIGNVHSNTPIYDNGFIYYVAGDGNRTVKLKLSDNGERISEVWRCLPFDNIMGGVVQIGNRLIATGHRKSELMSLDMGKGVVAERLPIGRGSTIYADGTLYIRHGKCLMAYNIKQV